MWLIIAAVVVIAVLILLLFLIPELFGTLALVGLILSIIGFFKGRVPLLGFQGRQKASWFGIAMLSMVVVSGSLMDSVAEKDTPPAPAAAPIVTSTESATPTPSESPSPSMLEDFVGTECDSDELVMDQAGSSLYCDKDSQGMLVWTGQEDHDEAVALAKKKAAEKKAAAAKKAAEEKAAKKKAEAEKAAKAKAEREAEEKAAAKAARKAEQEEAARLAELEQDQQSYVSYANCTEARAAGAAPIHRGEPGYASRLDRDGDGIGCDS